MRFVTVPRRIYAPPVLRSLFGARDFILTWKTGVNRPVAVVEFWRIAGAAAAKETAEERDQRYLYRVHRLRSRLERLELPYLVIDALEVGNQTDRQRPQVKTAFMQINSGLPSEQSPDGNREGIPNSLLEARATGLPCITTAHGEFLKRLRI